MLTLISQTMAAIPAFGHAKILHTLVGLGSAALAAADLPIVRRSEFRAMNKAVLKRNKILKFHLRKI